MQVKPGDIFCIPVPFKDDPFKSKKRPVLILRDEGNGLYSVAPITGTNYTGIKKGKWILHDTSVGKKMCLTKDSFILLDKVIQYPSFGLMDYWGHCPILNELLEMWLGKK
jgi:hypothetical protein